MNPFQQRYSLSTIRDESQPVDHLHDPPHVPHPLLALQGKAKITTKNILPESKLLHFWVHTPKTHHTCQPITKTWLQFEPKNEI